MAEVLRIADPAQPAGTPALPQNIEAEAALTAARRGHKTVEIADFTDSLEKILLGAPQLLAAAEDRLKL